MWDIPNLPKHLRKDWLETNPTKRSGKLKIVRHEVKEFLKNLLKQK